MTKKNIAQEEIYEELLQNELSLLAQNSHPNLIRIIDLLEDDENYYVVSELVKGGELFQRLLEVKNFTES
jgi:serine/threonine protein kinase